mmetsp:Transcript_32963/g.97165  ORF Transcript_32963/g.97165 Transcript_32963/m.97165 type:complete len:101 (-) Transcript_32963:966-1268(-)
MRLSTSSRPRTASGRRAVASHWGDAPRHNRLSRRAARNPVPYMPGLPVEVCDPQFAGPLLSFLAHTIPTTSGKSTSRLPQHKVGYKGGSQLAAPPAAQHY